MEVLSGRTDPRTKTISYRFRLADGGEGGLNIHENMTANGRFKPTSGSDIYFIEACLEYDYDYAYAYDSDDSEDYDYEKDYDEEDIDEEDNDEEDNDEEDYEGYYKKDGCNVIYELDEYLSD